MFQPFSLFVGLRYVRARRHKFFVSFITWVALAGVALGVAALIVVLSVMNGFGGELRTRLLALTAHARVVPAAADPGLAQRLRALPGVAGVAPYLDQQALGVHLPDMLPLTLRGIDPALEDQVTRMQPLMRAGSLSALQPGSDALILDSTLAAQLAVNVGDHVSILVPVVRADAAPTPRLREFTVAGIFDAGLADQETSFALAHLDDVRGLANSDAAAPALRLRFDDALEAPAIMPAVRRAAGAGALVRDWTEDHAGYFRALTIEKGMMALILLLIVAVAAFNIVAMLVMIVNEKRTDIAILRTLGASPRQVLAAFMTQGLAIGWFGVLSGVALGVVLARHVAQIAPLLERVFGFRFLDADTYYISEIPSVLQARDVYWIAAVALSLTLLSTIYPARRAAATPPADALRYE